MNLNKANPLICVLMLLIRSECAAEKLMFPGMLRSGGLEWQYFPERLSDIHLFSDVYPLMKFNYRDHFFHSIWSFATVRVNMNSSIIRVKATNGIAWKGLDGDLSLFFRLWQGVFLGAGWKFNYDKAALSTAVDQQFQQGPVIIGRMAW